MNLFNMFARAVYWPTKSERIVLTFSQLGFQTKPIVVHYCKWVAGGSMVVGARIYTSDHPDHFLESEDFLEQIAWLSVWAKYGVLTPFALLMFKKSLQTQVIDFAQKLRRKKQ